MNLLRQNYNYSCFYSLRIRVFIIFLFTYSAHSQCRVNTINNSFELPVLRYSASLINQDMVPGWRTTAPDRIIEFWRNGSNLDNLRSFAYDGEQYIELNASYSSGLYQDYDTSQNNVFTYSFAHRGRFGVDKMVLKAGPPNGPYTIVTTCSTGHLAWKLYSGIYVVPENQKVTRFIFEALSNSSNSPTIGNFLDAINFNSALEKPIVENVPAICSGGSVTLNAKSATEQEDGSIFQWYNSNKILIHTGKTFTSGPLLTSTKYSVIQITSSGCKSDYLDIEVKVNSGGTDFSEHDLLIQQKSSVSPDKCASLVAIIKNNTGTFEYKLDNGNFQSLNEFHNVSAGAHIITVRNLGQCSTSISKEIFIEALEKPLVEDPLPICPGNAVTLRAKSANDPKFQNIFNWYDANKVLMHTGETFTSAPLMTNTKFSVMQINPFGCNSDFLELEVKVHSGSANISGQDLLIQQTSFINSAQGTTLVAIIKNNTTAGYEYKLDQANFQSSNEFYNVASGIHTITVRDISSCIEFSKEIFVIAYPPFFTPNGDGYNERWNISNAGNDDLSFSNLFIFDRYGKLLKQLNPLGEGWDGTYNGQPLPSSDYWFTLECTIGGIQQKFKAHFSLKR
ncbi:T9SS type B sorting domain-containing protein [Flavobacterium sp. FlaQc-48]|uniref:T9SS type B sorting domain-containing protein n=1 Tax=Flavobacterium sp. FlaQc-48 TaxID=3374181 RepID=UPI00375818F0